ncbi:DUF167 family protein [Luteithermobacter gelatinilyticus]|uniref:DUF167 family protein n=1 Tax=Luteithermobacter gelatinilyticus TaxID=2582913 RepID=UPI0011075A53|nr:DUF167 family protein [Luteithermobacter gelatinilyticus]|tara:strand:+ start:23556 stop:23879 length:324 start_codon:yes stop_codon:yes gene_type:complete
MATWLHRTPTGVRLAIRLNPNAARNDLGPLERRADGSWHLKARVTTAPEGGRANAALMKLLAKTFRLPVSKISVASGATNRNKQIDIEGDPEALHTLFNNWIKDRFP